MAVDAGSSIQLERCNEMADSTANNSNASQNVNKNNTAVDLQQLLNSMGQQQKQQLLQQNNINNMLLLSRSHPSSSSCGSTIDVNAALPQKRSADNDFLNPSTTVAAATGVSSSSNCTNGNKRLKEDEPSNGNQVWNRLQLQQQQREQLKLLMGRLGMTNATTNIPMGQQSPAALARMMVMSNNNTSINLLQNNLLMGGAGASAGNGTNNKMTTNSAPAAIANMRTLKSSKNSFPMPMTGKIFAYKRPKLSTYKSMWQRTKPELRKSMLNYQMERSNVKLSKTRSSDVISSSTSSIIIKNEPKGMDVENQSDVKQIQQQQQQLLQDHFRQQASQRLNQQPEQTISTNEPEDGAGGVYHV